MNKTNIIKTLLEAINLIEDKKTKQGIELELSEFISDIDTEELEEMEERQHKFREENNYNEFDLTTLITIQEELNNREEGAENE